MASARPPASAPHPRGKPPAPVATVSATFTPILALIQAAKHRAYQAINTELINLHWQIGEHLSDKLSRAEWRDAVIDELAATIAREHPGLRGFSRPNLFRMQQFFDAYRSDAKVSSLLRQLPWTHHLIILSRAKHPEERTFYIVSAIHGRWSTRELERQIRAQAFRRSVLEPPKTSRALAVAHPGSPEQFKNAYSLEFLGLALDHSVADLHAGLLRNLVRFITELGPDFCFVGSEYPVQVGNQDFKIDLVFFHRGLACLVAFELKIREFRPEDLGKLSFYLEALDRDVKKPHERPSIGVLLCATKDDEVVEYALSRTLSPALVAEYHLALPSRAVLQSKLHELYALLAPEAAEPAAAVPRAKGAAKAKPKAKAPVRTPRKPGR